jgi:ABC-2 type transport system permease protein
VEAFLLDIYRTQLKVWINLQLQYRVALVIWLIGMILEPLIYLVVWTTVARQTGGEVGGFTPSTFAAYFVTLMLVNHATFTWIMWEFDYRIRQGQLSPMLLRPVHPIHNDIAQNLSYKLLSLSVLAPAAAVLGWVFGAQFDTTLYTALAFIPALLLAFLLRFMLEWTLALAAFWTTRVVAINEMYYVALIFLSGQVAPLSLFPRPVGLVANVLPFRWMVGFPIELLLNRLTPEAIITGFGAQVVWLALSVALLRFVWRLGLRKYSAVGS